MGRIVGLGVKTAGGGTILAALTVPEDSAHLRRDLAGMIEGGNHLAIWVVALTLLFWAAVDTWRFFAGRSAEKQKQNREEELEEPHNREIDDIKSMHAGEIEGLERTIKELEERLAVIEDVDEEEAAPLKDALAILEQEPGRSDAVFKIIQESQDFSLAASVYEAWECSEPRTGADEVRDAMRERLWAIDGESREHAKAFLRLRGVPDRFREEEEAFDARRQKEYHYMIATWEELW